MVYVLDFEYRIFLKRKTRFLEKYFQSCFYGGIVRTRNFFLKLCRASDKISRAHDILSRAHEIICRAHDY